MWRLRQRIELSRIQPAWHQIVSCAFRRALDQDRCLDLDKVAFVQERPDSLDYLVPEHKVLLHLRPAKVKVAVLQANRLINVAVLFIDLERRGLCSVDNCDLGSFNLDVTCRHARVFRAFGPLSNVTNDLNDKL